MAEFDKKAINSHDRIRELEEKLKNSVSIEDAITYKLYHNSVELIKKWASVYLIFGGFTIVFFGALGFKTYNDIDRIVKAEISGTVKVKLIGAIDSIKVNTISELEKEKINAVNAFSKRSEDLKNEFNKKSLKFRNSLDKELASSVDQIKKEHQTKIQKIATEVSRGLNKPELARSIARTASTHQLNGYAYYGIYQNGKWSERNFNNLTTSSTRFPQVNDVVEANIPVNIRSGVIQYSDETGWQNQKLIGSLSSGDKVKVKKIQRVAGGAFVWIQFDK